MQAKYREPAILTGVWHYQQRHVERAQHHHAVRVVQVVENDTGRWYLLLTVEHDDPERVGWERWCGHLSFRSQYRREAQERRDAGAARVAEES